MNSQDAQHLKESLVAIHQSLTSPESMASPESAPADEPPDPAAASDPDPDPALPPAPAPASAVEQVRLPAFQKVFDDFEGQKSRTFVVMTHARTRRYRCR